MIPAGQLDKRITLQSPTISYDSYNEPITTYNDIATVWARIRYKKGREIFQGRQTIAEMPVEIAIRYRADVISTWRIKYGNRYFLIIAPPVNVDERNENLLLYCKEVV